MKILFIFSNIGTLNKKQYPHGIGALSAVLKKAGHHIDLIYLTEDPTKEYFFAEMAKYSFDLAGISLMTNQWEIVKKLPAWIKEKHPSMPVILGGIHPTLAPDEVIAVSGVDIVCRGEGEIPLLKLVGDLEAGRDYSSIPGLWVKRKIGEETEIIRNTAMPLVSDLDSLPFSDREMLDYQDLLYNHSYDEHPQEVTIMAGRGCPFDCTYCCNKSLKGLYDPKQAYARKRSVDNVIGELKDLLRKYSIKSFYFEDDTFTLDRRWVEEFCRKYRQEIGLPFKIYIRPLTFDFELLKNLKDAGLYYVNIGVECGNEEYRQKILKRNITNEQLVEIFGWLNELKIMSLAFIIIGLPDETKEMIIESMDLIKRLRPYHTQISVYYPYPANELYADCQKKGLLTGRRKTTFFGGISTIKSKHLNPRDLQKLHDEFWQLSHRLRRSWPEPLGDGGINGKTNDGLLSKLKFALYKPYFVLIDLPLFLAREPYWLFKLTQAYRRYGLYRALQTVFDYHTLINNSEAANYNKKIDSVIFKPAVFKKLNAGLYFDYQPKISIVVPIFNPDRHGLHEMIKSVLRQSYCNWELCLADGTQQRDKLIIDMIEYYSQKDKRIKINYLPCNLGIAGNSNEAIRMAGGEYVGFLDHDDELSADALWEAVKALNGPARDAGLIYSDEDKIDFDGSYYEPFYKPDWSPDYLMSVNYICHFAIVKADLLKALNGFDVEMDGAQDFDLFLRLSERTKNIYHLPKILYHWRKSLKSTSALIGSKPYVFNAGRKALAAALKRRGIPGEVIILSDTGTARVRYEISGSPMVSIIIPFRDGVQLTKKCLGSILKKTAYRNFEIILVDNQSRDALGGDLAPLAEKYGISVRLIAYDREFNYSAMNNFTARQAKGKHLLFLNNDTEAISEEWLSAMLEHAQRSGVGAVGAKLIYPNGKIQHCGVNLSYSKIGEHYYRGLHDDEVSAPGRRFACVGNVGAVTGACLMVRKEIFESVGGFDENLPNNFNDVDLCLKLRSLGFLTVFTPYALLYHYESATRLPNVAEWEISYMQKKWRQELSHDPYSGKN